MTRMNTLLLITITILTALPFAHAETPTEQKAVLVTVAYCSSMGKNALERMEKRNVSAENSRLTIEMDDSVFAVLAHLKRTSLALLA